MLDPILATRLDKAATDTGYDLKVAGPDGWLGFASTLAPLQVWLTPMGSDFLAAFSMEHVARALAEHGALVHQPLPPGAAAALLVGDLSALHALLGRSLPLARTLPTALLDQFVTKAATLPRTIEAERWASTPPTAAAWPTTERTSSTGDAPRAQPAAACYTAAP